MLAVVAGAAGVWLFVLGLADADSIGRVKGSNQATSLAAAYFTAASLFAATGGWLVSNAVSLLSRTRDKASEFIKVAQGDAEFLDALAYIAAVSNDPKNQPLLADPKGRHGFYLSSDGLKFRRSMRDALNTFDEMAIFIRRGAADEAILRDFYVGMLVRFYEIYCGYLPYITNIPQIVTARDQRPEIPANVDWLYKRWSAYYSRKFFYLGHRSRITLDRLPLSVPAKYL